MLRALAPFPETHMISTVVGSLIENAGDLKLVVVFEVEVVGKDSMWCSI